jgi:hypothetical protein
MYFFHPGRSYKGSRTLSLVARTWNAKSVTKGIFNLLLPPVVKPGLLGWGGSFLKLIQIFAV